MLPMDKGVTLSVNTFQGFPYKRVFSILQMPYILQHNPRKEVLYTLSTG